MQDSKKLRTFAALFQKKQYEGSGFSAVGSAHVWGARGRWFESSNPDRSEGVETKVSAPFLFVLRFLVIICQDPNFEDLRIINLRSLKVRLNKRQNQCDFQSMAWPDAVDACLYCSRYLFALQRGPLYIVQNGLFWPSDRHRLTPQKGIDWKPKNKRINGY